MTRPSNTFAAAHALHESEAGFISLINIIAILLCTILMGLVVNTGNMVRHKIEVQNAADATAYTDALWHARGMNAVTMTNHVMGEITAFVILHEAIGGKDLDKKNQKDQTAIVDGLLDLAFRGAQIALPAIMPQQSVYDTVRQKDGIKAERTLLDSKTQLKQILLATYAVKVAAAALEKFILTYGIGMALDTATFLMELKIYQEYQVLKAIHQVASGLIKVSEALQNFVLPAAKGYTDVIQSTTPGIGLLAASDVAQRNRTTGFVFHSSLTLPLAIDPVAKNLTSGSPEMLVKRTQLVRAAYPWVTFHRKPILDFMRIWLTLSGAEGFYKKHSDECTIVVCLRLQTEKDIKLYMLQGDKSPDKGFEDWTNDSRKADNMFTVVGFVHREEPPVVSPVIYSHEQSDGIVTFAQAMFYNANPQKPSLLGGRQADVGWDTLNWESPPVEFRTDDRSTEFPKIKLNWQAKLVPVTNNRMLQAQPAAMLQNRYRKVLERTVGLSPLSHH